MVPEWFCPDMISQWWHIWADDCKVSKICIQSCNHKTLHSICWKDLHLEFYNTFIWNKNQALFLRMIISPLLFSGSVNGLMTSWHWPRLSKSLPILVTHRPSPTESTRCIPNVTVHLNKLRRIKQTPQMGWLLIIWEQDSSIVGSLPARFWWVLLSVVGDLTCVHPVFSCNMHMKGHALGSPLLLRTPLLLTGPVLTALLTHLCTKSPFP